jgi:MFS family permease
MADEQRESDDRGVVGHTVRGLGESTRHNSLAYGYSLALTGSFGVLTTLVAHASVVEIFCFGIGASLPFPIANTAVTRAFTVKVEGEPPVVLALGTSIGVVSVCAAIGAATVFGWLLDDWLAWLVGSFAASAVYLFASALELVVARGVRALLGRDKLAER